MIRYSARVTLVLPLIATLTLSLVHGLAIALEMSIDLSFLLPSTYGPWAYRYAMG
jgi:hypothetical protein